MAAAVALAAAATVATATGQARSTQSAQAIAAVAALCAAEEGGDEEAAALYKQAPTPVLMPACFAFLAVRLSINLTACMPTFIAIHLRTPSRRRPPACAHPTWRSISRCSASSTTARSHNSPSITLRQFASRRVGAWLPCLSEVLRGGKASGRYR
eukprot:6194114-Pleurochrysis_carterae.AAC.1